MDDEEFLNYVDAHSRSERALFSGEHLIRLRELSGMFLTAMGGINPDGFYALHDDQALPMVRRAREKLLATKAAHRMMSPRVSSKDITSSRNIELTDAIKEWRGLTDEQRERFYNAKVVATDLGIAQFAVRLLKAAAR